MSAGSATLRQHLRYLGSALLPVAAMLVAAISGGAQESPVPRVGLPYDWSHHYVIFSRSSSSKVMAAVRHDMRYWQQRARMEPPNLAERPAAVKKRKHVDWSVNLGGTASTTYTAPPTPQTVTITASVNGLPPATFTETVHP